MDEEAGFIHALLAEPDDRTVLLAYADWLQDRDDPRAEYLRLVAAGGPRQRLVRSGAILDTGWVWSVTYRRYPIGCRVRIHHGPFAGMEGELTAGDANRGLATVAVMLWGRPVNLDLHVVEFERIDP